MKKNYLFLLIILTLAVRLSAQVDEKIQLLLTETNIDSLSRTINDITGENPVTINGNTYTILNRFSYSTYNDLAADYLYNRLLGYGYSPVSQPFVQSGKTGRNIYAEKTGTTYPDQKFIICAHYDDTSYVGNAPGADDNASGTAAVLEMARLLSKQQTKYTVVFCFWDSEENGLNGSWYFARQSKLNNVNIKGVINLDMIGWDGNNDGVIEVHSDNNANSIAIKDSALIINNIYSVNLTMQTVIPGRQGSDHVSFWFYGFPAIWFIEDFDGTPKDFNPYYHSSNDRLLYFNLNYYLKAVSLALGTLSHLAELEEPFPVELSSFTASLTNKSVLLQWKTNTETNNYGFEIEKRSAANLSLNSDWRNIGFISGNGNSNSEKHYSFTDDNVRAGKYYYRLKQYDNDGSFNYSDVISIDIPSAFSDLELFQNYPNPFNSQTMIGFYIPASFVSNEFISIKLYDVLGNEVKTIFEGMKNPGLHEVELDADELSAGLYFYRLSSPNNFLTRKLTLLK
jgi:hypothetical protein